MKYFKRLIKALLAGILGFLLFGLGYNLFIGKPITLNHYFSEHNVSYMKIGLEYEDGTILKSKELSEEEIETFIKQFGSYKIYKPFFRITFIAKQDNNHINIILSDDNINNETRNFEIMFFLSDQGSVNLMRYTFYPYKAKHMDMYNYLINLMGS